MAVNQGKLHPEASKWDTQPKTPRSVPPNQSRNRCAKAGSPLCAQAAGSVQPGPREHELQTGPSAPHLRAHHEAGVLEHRELARRVPGQEALSARAHQHRLPRVLQQEAVAARHGAGAVSRVFGPRAPRAWKAGARGLRPVTPRVCPLYLYRGRKAKGARSPGEVIGAEGRRGQGARGIGWGGVGGTAAQVTRGAGVGTERENVSFIDNGELLGRKEG